MKKRYRVIETPMVDGIDQLWCVEDRITGERFGHTDFRETAKTIAKKQNEIDAEPKFRPIFTGRD